jgi:hypothetical protein
MLYHGSNNPALSIDDIAVIRNGAKQGKKGRSYGGFYCADNLTHAMQYANMSGNTPAIFNVMLCENIKTFHKSGDVTRLSAEYINSLLIAGYQMIEGKDLFGRNEYVIIDKSAIKSIE